MSRPPDRMSDRIEFEYSGTIAGRDAWAVADHAAARGISPAELMMRVIEAVLKDNLIDAILDDRG